MEERSQKMALYFKMEDVKNRWNDVPQLDLQIPLNPIKILSAFFCRNKQDALKICIEI